MRGNRRILKIIAGVAAAGGLLYLAGKLAFKLAVRNGRLGCEEKNYFNWEYGRIYYMRRGQGTPLIMVHEPDASGSGYIWSRIVDIIAKEHTVYIIDLPGCGRSGREKLLYTNYLYADALCSFARGLGLENASIITDGNASSVAVMACQKERTLFDKLIFINPESFEHMVRKECLCERLLCSILLLPVLGTAVYAAMNMRCVIRGRLRKDVFSDTGTASEEVVNAFVEAAHLGGTDARFTMAGIIGRYTDLNVVFALKKLGNRVYLIGGEEVEDIRYTLEGYRYFCGNVGGEKIIPGKMLPQFEYPQRAADVILRFMQER